MVGKFQLWYSKLLAQLLFWSSQLPCLPLLKFNAESHLNTLLISVIFLFLCFCESAFREVRIFWVFIPNQKDSQFGKIFCKPASRLSTHIWGDFMALETDKTRKRLSLQGHTSATGLSFGSRLKLDMQIFMVKLDKFHIICHHSMFLQQSKQKFLTGYWGQFVIIFFKIVFFLLKDQQTLLHFC